MAQVLYPGRVSTLPGIVQSQLLLIMSSRFLPMPARCFATMEAYWATVACPGPVVLAALTRLLDGERLPRVSWILSGDPLPDTALGVGVGCPPKTHQERGPP